MYNNILVPVDGSKNAEAAVKEAIKIAKMINATLHIVSVVADQHYTQFGVTLGQDVMDSIQKKTETTLSAMKQLVEQNGVNGVTHYVIGTAKSEIAYHLPEEYDADLIVIGKSGVNKIISRALGSTAEYVVRNAKVNVLVVNDDYNNK